MKRISFNVAKAIKKAGYPQDCYDEYWVKFKNKPEPLIISGDEALDFYENISDETDENYVEDYYAVVEYLETWLWLWREKKITLLNVGNINNEAQIDILQDGVFIHTTNAYPDPEEAIIAAINYLVEKDLIK